MGLLMLRAKLWVHVCVDNDGSDEAETDAEVRVRPEVRDRPGGRDRPPRRSAALNADIFRRLANF